MSSGKKYHRTIHGVNDDGPGLEVDVYCVLEAFDVICPARAHAIKKLLCAGLRGSKTPIQDLEETLTSIHRAIQLETQRSTSYWGEQKGNSQ